MSARSRLAARTAVIFIFGVLVPVILLIQAYSGTANLNETLARSAHQASVARTLREAQPVLRSANDYALFAQLSAERVNEAVVVNKQIMKSSVVKIGFAVISIGLMFVILGFNDGGGTGNLTAGGMALDFKTTSTGAVVFVIGAAMATAGGVLRNDYNTVPIPNFVNAGASPEESAQRASIEAYSRCYSELKEGSEQCFVSLFKKINADYLR